MPGPSLEVRTGPLLDELKVLIRHRKDAEAAGRKAKFEIEQIKSGSRLKDRYRWLLNWMNGDRAVYDRLQPLRVEIKKQNAQIKDVSSRRAWLFDEIDKIIVDHLAENDPGYQGTRIEQRGLDRKRDLCRELLTVVSKTRKMAVSGRKPGEISAHVKVVHDKVVDLNKMPKSARSVSSEIVRRLGGTNLDGESDPPQRRRDLTAVVRTMDTVKSRVDAIRRGTEKQLKKLEKKRAELVKTTRDRLLSAHGLQET